MIENIIWRAPINKWYNVDKDAYKIIFEQAEKRFEDVMSESESITDKSIKMISTLAALLGFAIGFIYQHLPCGVNWLIQSFAAIVTGIEAILLFILIAPKKTRSRGLSPNNSIPQNLDNEEDSKVQVELVYYQGIIILQDNIEYMMSVNKFRAGLYKWALAIFLALFMASVAIVSYLL